MKKYLLIIKNSPYQSSQANETLEFAFALSAFNQTVALLFIDEGVLQLAANQNATAISYKSFTKAYEGLSLFDISDVYVAQTSLQKYPELNLMIQPQIADAIQIAELIAAHDIVLTL